MERGIRRRLDVLIALVSGLLGIVTTYLILSPRTDPLFFLFSFFTTVVIWLLALWYTEG